ncbi:uncharacterized protein LOC133922761 isoform X1 [Phragmites australis]|uniref:uncharacterized protein LOC133922761 isoform X1 n=1 Tax=Phragmites australis TaxID=29695 RepID=UPI002D7737EB|nr:uncharacterized protein LOC133922761 isoform X1 [Phragmites australis]
MSSLFQHTGRVTVRSICMLLYLASLSSFTHSFCLHILLRNLCYRYRITYYGTDPSTTQETNPRLARFIFFRKIGHQLIGKPPTVLIAASKADPAYVPPEISSHIGKTYTATVQMTTGSLQSIDPTFQVQSLAIHARLSGRLLSPITTTPVPSSEDITTAAQLRSSTAFAHQSSTTSALNTQSPPTSPEKVPPTLNYLFHVPQPNSVKTYDIIYVFFPVQQLVPSSTPPPQATPTCQAASMASSSTSASHKRSLPSTENLDTNIPTTRSLSTDAEPHCAARKLDFSISNDKN